jgi:hypothetical protein
MIGDYNVFLVERRHNALNPSDFPFAGLGDRDRFPRQTVASVAFNSRFNGLVMDSSIKFQKRLVFLIVIVLMVTTGYFLGDISLVATSWGQRVHSLSVAP